MTIYAIKTAYQIFLDLALNHHQYFCNILSKYLFIAFVLTIPGPILGPLNPLTMTLYLS